MPTWSSVKGSSHSGAANSRSAQSASITHYLEKYASSIIEKKKVAMAPACPLLPRTSA